MSIKLLYTFISAICAALWTVLAVALGASPVVVVMIFVFCFAIGYMSLAVVYAAGSRE